MVIKIGTHKELRVYKMAFEAAMDIFQLTRSFPAEERYSLTSQVCRSSRSVCANLAEAWRKRRYRAAFIAKLSDCESEASETLVYIEFALRCDFLDYATASALEEKYDHIIAQLVCMIRQPEKWIL